MWRKLQQNHPVIYEAIQWGILVIAAIALVISAINVAETYQSMKEPVQLERSLK